jgi:hypothetical protein
MSGICAVRSRIASFASAWTLARRPRTKGLPIKKKITRPKIGVTMISSNHAMEDDGRRLPGTVPSATILIVNSTRYKISGAQAIAFTDITLSFSEYHDIGRGGSTPHLQWVNCRAGWRQHPTQRGMLT